jgi:uncharacterized protein YdeI (BOF family)
MPVKVILAIIALVWFSHPACADEPDRPVTISNLPYKGTSLLAGNVEEIKDERTFLLTDPSGYIDVHIVSDTSLMLRPGDRVYVTGTSHTGLLGRNFEATRIQVKKDPATTLTKAPTDAAEPATPVKVNQLPKEGIVQVSGHVEHIDDAQHFTVKDYTGKVKVELQGDDYALMQEGVPVMVVGFVHDGFLGKEIRATRMKINRRTLRPSDP